MSEYYQKLAKLWTKAEKAKSRKKAKKILKKAQKLVASDETLGEVSHSSTQEV